MKRVSIGIMSQEGIRKRVLAIAKGDLKPKPGDPKIWFTSIKSLSEVLSEDNRALLKEMERSKPNSIGELAHLTGRNQSNLSRTLKTMSKYGLVELSKRGRTVQPVAKATDFKIYA
ncbi:MAG: ArsR family transcriptional regulator [Rhodospirillales bacterium]|jgi:predicted transcriptional regulator|nr:ArsR family transcriptional regulator [Rhodospirillales bacterium]MBT4041365.1 ArsR family transcriptional regulator [Rhodospirillales bacterium]MBT4626289.1 ArsR family transcriptional regulator [Rhodospirillales bacterium]MBT5353044.1 ArsR family transcriptional regulator [Rhodospirillales bacterium]MBT5520521.1 ArsR family transcriptional regulator [Rhodospirillales bacterium]